jgi:hypothetical protein
VHRYLEEPHILRAILLCYLEFFNNHYPAAPINIRLTISSATRHVDAMDQVIRFYATGPHADPAIVDIAQRVVFLMA